MTPIAARRADRRAEAIANAVTSGVGTTLAVAGLAVLLAYAALEGGLRYVIGTGVFGAALFDVIPLAPAAARLAS